MSPKEIQTAKPFAIVAIPESVHLMRAGFEAGIETFQLPRIRVPAGGATAWTVANIDGEQLTKELDCIIGMTRSKLKAWWRNADGTGAPPDCSSQDGLMGLGNNREDLSPEGEGQHDCISCGWNKWGSDRKGGKGRDCKDFAEMYIFTEESRMPYLLNIPPMSLKEMSSYHLRLLSAGLRPESVVTRMTLTKMQNAGGQSFSQIQFSMLRRLEGDQLAQSKEMSQQLQQLVVASLATRRQPVST